MGWLVWADGKSIVNLNAVTLEEVLCVVIEYMSSVVYRVASILLEVAP